MWFFGYANAHAKQVPGMLPFASKHIKERISRFILDLRTLRNKTYLNVKKKNWKNLKNILYVYEIGLKFSKFYRNRRSGLVSHK